MVDMLHGKAVLLTMLLFGYRFHYLFPEIKLGEYYAIENQDINNYGLFFSGNITFFMYGT